jgi:hypothetical protein
VSPLEERRIPSFPVFVLLVLVVLGGLVFLMLPKPGVASFGFVVRVLSNGTPVVNASVRFLGVGGSFLGGGLTDKSGVSEFTGSGLSSVFVSASGFQSSHFIVKPGLNVVSLNASPVVNVPSNTSTNQGINTTAGFNSLASNGGGLSVDGSRVNASSSLSVSLVSGGLSVDGFVSVYDNTTGMLEYNGQTVNGSVYFSNVSLGETVYFTVSGVYSLSSSPVVSLQAGLNSVTLNVSLLSSVISGESFVYVFSAVDNSSLNASVAVLNPENQVFFTGSTVNGFVNFTVPDGSYYAVVSAPGFISGYTTFFSTPYNESVSLTPDSVGSASLSVNVFDDQNNILTSGSVAVKSLDGRFLAFPQNNTQGTVVFNDLPVNMSVNVVASVGDETGLNQTYLLNGVNSVNVFVFVNFGFLNVTAFDVLKGGGLSFNATVNFSEGVLGNQTVSCSGGAGGCLLKVEGDTNLLVFVSSPGFFDGVAPFNVGVGNVTNVSVGLVGSGSGEGVGLAGVYPYETSTSVSSLIFGENYSACFNVYARNDSSFSGFYVGSPDIQVFSTPNNMKVVGGASTDCSGGPAMSSGSYSWVDLSKGGALNSSSGGPYCVGFFVPSNRAWLNLSLNYRVYSVFNNNGSFFYFYLPFNSSIGYNKTDECSPGVFQSFFNVSDSNTVVDNPPNPSSGIGSLNVSFNQTAMNGSVFTCGDGESVFNCNDFTGLSGYTNPLVVNFIITPELLNFGSGSVYDLTLKGVQNAGVIGGNVSLFSSSGVFNVSLSNGVADVSGGLSGGVISGFVLLNLTGGSPAGFTMGFTNGSESINRSFSFNVVNVSPPTIFPEYDCANSPFINLTYNGNTPFQSGNGTSGWEASCHNIPMMISDVFPADAVKVYVNASNGCSGFQTLQFWNSSVSGLSSCFNFDLTGNDSEGNYTVVRFSPDFSGCPLHVVGNQPLVYSNGNVTNNVSATLITACTSPSVNNCGSFAGGVGDCKFLNVTVFSESTGEGLNLLPVMTSSYIYNLGLTNFISVFNWLNISSKNNIPTSNCSLSCVTQYNSSINGPSGCTATCSGDSNHYSCSVLNNFTAYYEVCGSGGVGFNRECINSNPVQAFNLTCGNYSPSFIYSPKFNLLLSNYTMNPQLWVLVNNNQLGARNVVLNFTTSLTQQNPLDIPFNGAGATALSIDWSVFNDLLELINGAYYIPYNPSGHVMSGVNYFRSVASNFIDYYLSLDQNTSVYPNAYSESSFNDAYNSINLNESTFGGSVTDYLNYFSGLLNQTSLWRSGGAFSLWCGNCSVFETCKPSLQAWINTSNLTFVNNVPVFGWLNSSSPLTYCPSRSPGSPDPGAPLKYFQNTSSFVRVFKVDSNDVLSPYGYTSTVQFCPRISENLNDLLNNTGFVTSNMSFFMRIPRGFYVVNYTYTVDSNGNPSGGYNGWTIQSTPLVLNSSNYFNNGSRAGNGGCNYNFISPSIPLCGYVFSTNNTQSLVGGNVGLGSCILSSGAYNDSLSDIFKSGSSSDKSWLISNYGYNQLVDSTLYVNNLIPVNFECTNPSGCFSGSIKSFQVSYFDNFYNLINNGWTEFVYPGWDRACSLNFNNTNYMFGVFDDAGNLWVPESDCSHHQPACTGLSSWATGCPSGGVDYNGFALTPNGRSEWNGGSCNPTNNNCGSGNNWVFNAFDQLGLH